MVIICFTFEIQSWLFYSMICTYLHHKWHKSFRPCSQNSFISLKAIDVFFAVSTAVYICLLHVEKNVTLPGSEWAAHSDTKTKRFKMIDNIHDGFDVQDVAISHSYSIYVHPWKVHPWMHIMFSWVYGCCRNSPFLQRVISIRVIVMTTDILYMTLTPICTN